MHRAGKFFVACVAVFAVASWLTARAAADDFRIATKVFSGTATEPIGENVTLFRGSQVYDFLSKPNEITLFDKTRNRVILMDPIRKVKAEVKGERLAAFSVELRGWCERQTDPLLKFAAEPRFDETMDEATGEMVFASPLMTYRIKPMKSDTEVISRQYLEFSDSYARLNSLTNPGSLPPFPRLAVNEALFRSRSIPENVQLTIASRGRLGGRAMTLRSEHTVNWRLLDSDLQKIDEAGEFLVTFTPISLEKYLRIDEHEARK
jgi:hypothetical protein